MVDVVVFEMFVIEQDVQNQFGECVQNYCEKGEGYCLDKYWLQCLVCFGENFLKVGEVYVLIVVDVGGVGYVEFGRCGGCQCDLVFVDVGDFDFVWCGGVFIVEYQCVVDVVWCVVFEGFVQWCVVVVFGQLYVQVVGVEDCCCVCSVVGVIVVFF